jgi:hypothetical protein
MTAGGKWFDVKNTTVLHYLSLTMPSNSTILKYQTLQNILALTSCYLFTLETESETSFYLTLYHIYSRNDALSTPPPLLGLK